MKKTIQIIIPVCNESETIPLLVRRLNLLKRSTAQYTLKVIFVDDGSSDDSVYQIRKLMDKQDELICLSRNFGHQIAITAGIDYSQADAVVIIDADLQDPPELIGDMIALWEKGFDVVYAKRRSRKDTPFKTLSAHFFYRVLNVFSSLPIPADTGDFRLMDRKVVDAIKLFRESNRFLRGLISYVGYRQSYILFDRDKRAHGVTKYPLSKMIKFGIDGVLSFSTIPLRMITSLGFLIALLSIFGIAYVLYMKLFFPEVTVSGWSLIMITIFFMSSIQMIVLGVIGEYIGRIYTEVQQRPLYLVDSDKSRLSEAQRLAHP